MKILLPSRQKAGVTIATFAAILFCQAPTPAAPTSGAAQSQRSEAWFESAAAQVAAAPDESTYRAAVAQLLTGLQQQMPVSHWKGSYRMGGATLKFVNSDKKSKLWDISYFDTVFPARQVDASAFRTRVAYDGHGLPVVAWRAQSQERNRSQPFLPPVGLPSAATAVVDVTRSASRGDEVVVRFYDTTYSPAGIAADLTAPVAALLNAIPEPRTSMGGLLRETQNVQDAGLTMIEPYRSDKIPVVMVHGLNSIPRTWADVANELRADPVISSRYQFWFFGYPTGIPLPVSAALLRNSLQSIRAFYDPQGKNSRMNEMVLVGHSMGGLLSRIMVTDAGDAFWNIVSNRPLDQLRLSNEDRTLLQSSLQFEAQPYVKRVVFVATPHRGSDMATGLVGNLAKRLVSLPSAAIGLPARIAANNPGVVDGNLEFPTSIDNLRPTNPFLRVLQSQPLHAPYHSIIGNNGVDNGANSTDGVVPYWSSHLDYAQSEVIVPADHSSHSHPMAIREMDRILREHLASRAPASNRRKTTVTSTQAAGAQAAL